MRPNALLAERYALPAFLILTPVISLGIGLWSRLPTEGIALALVLVPPVMALLLAALAAGRMGAADLLRALVRWRIGSGGTRSLWAWPSVFIWPLR
jgi:hypothetical protein